MINFESRETLSHGKENSEWASRNFAVKNLLFMFIVFLFILFQLSANAQMGHGRFKQARDKLDQLEKVKLIEVLNMNEETTLKFFARRNAFRNQADSLMQLSDDIIDYLDTSIKSGNGTEDSYKNKIAEYLTIQNQIVNTRNKFINSLSDILSEEQIAKLIVFEKKFREDIRKLIFKRPPDWKK
jgi:hypothetical protein